MSENQCPYTLLGVERNADEKTIKKSYRKLMMQYHEDRVSNKVRAEGLEGTEEGNKRIQDAREMASEINVAEGILTDTEARKVYDQYGHAGLDALQNGEDPAKARTAGRGPTFRDAADVFGGTKDPLDGISDDELMNGEETTSKRERRDVSDILKNAKHGLDHEDKPLDELLDEMRHGTPEKKTETKDKKPSGPSIRETAGKKLGNLFGKAMNKAEELITDAQDSNPTPAAANSTEIAARLETVAEALAESNGQLNKFELKSIIEELAHIANEVQGETPQPNRKNDHGF